MTSAQAPNKITNFKLMIKQVRMRWVILIAIGVVVLSVISVLVSASGQQGALLVRGASVFIAFLAFIVLLCENSDDVKTSPDEAKLAAQLLGLRLLLTGAGLVLMGASFFAEASAFSSHK